jgi:2'-5' RNA ligase
MSRSGTRPAATRVGAGRDDPAAARRLFVAMPLPSEAVDVVVSLVADLRRRVPGAETVRWVRMDGLHLTLRFLGPVEEDGIPALSSAVDDVAQEQSPFGISISGGGAFPAIARPRIIWLGITTGAADLASMAGRLGSRIETLGWAAEERPFRAHLTLARCDGVRAGPAVARELTSIAESLDLSFQVGSLVLFESLTGRGPARYVPVHEAKLRS